jgi:hypothetical protein
MKGVSVLWEGQNNGSTDDIIVTISWSNKNRLLYVRNEEIRQ